MGDWADDYANTLIAIIKTRPDRTDDETRHILVDVLRLAFMRGRRDGLDEAYQVVTRAGRRLELVK